MGCLTMGHQSQLSSVVGDTPGDQVQNVLGQLPARPLIPVHDGQVQGDDAQTLTADAVALDPLVAVTGPAEDPLSPPEYLIDVPCVRCQHILERALGPGHQAQA